jgi:HJR/Mrr/RecB family endonuclease
MRLSEQDAGDLAAAIVSRHAMRIGKFLEIAYRKVATPDEYGDENKEALHTEFGKLIDKLAETEDVLRSEAGYRRKEPAIMLSVRGIYPVSGAIFSRVESRFEEYYRHRKEIAARFDARSVAELSGKHFELYLADLLRTAGVSDISTTPETGDQGGDLLFSCRGRRIVLQAKRYSGTVGNKAIQEAHAARAYYGCDRAWVVTNSRFSQSARTLAKELDVLLVDGDRLPRLAEVVRGAGPID